MSLNKWTPALFVQLLAVQLLAAQQAPPLVCPATVEAHKFERISVYNFEAGGKEYELAPDDEMSKGGKVIQTWKLAAYRTMGIFVRCRYHDTDAVIQKEVPPKIASCVLRLVMNKSGSIAGPSEMQCK